MNIYSKILFPLFILVFINASGQGLFEQALSETDSSANENIQLNGFVRSLAYIGRNTDENEVYMQSMYSQFALVADVNAGKYGSAYADMRFRSGNEFGKKLAQIELREAYADMYLGPIDLRIGKQILSWGATSFLNPSDQFSPQNPTYRSPIHDDLRIGTWALRSNLAINSNSKLQIIWIPRYTPSVLPTDVFSFPEYIEFGDDIVPGPEIKEGSFGFNYDLRSKLLDLEISYFHGYRNNPSIKLDTAIFNSSTFQPELFLLTKKPYRINSAGINLTIPIGSYLFRTEGSWMDPMENESETLPYSELSYTAEIEQSGENITVIAGYWGKYIIDFEKPESSEIGLTNEFPDAASLFPPGTTPDPAMINGYIDAQINGFNRLYNYQNAAFYHSAYAAITVSMFHQLIDVELPGMYNFTSGELSLMPSLKFNITDGLSFQLGAYYLYGNENTLSELIAPVLNAGYGLIQLKF